MTDARSNARASPARVPVRTERASRGVRVVEHVFRDLADLRAALLRARRERGIVQDLDHRIDVLLELLGRGSRPRRRRVGEAPTDDYRDGEEMA